MVSGKFIRKFKYQIFVLIALLVGLILLQIVLKSYENAKAEERYDQLKLVHSEAVIRVETGIEIYSTIVSSMKAFVENTDSFPTKRKFQNYLSQLVRDVGFEDSIIVSYLDTSLTFNFVVTPETDDPSGLVGVSVKDFRPTEQINRMKNLIERDTAILFNPINLKEGWPAFPFNFTAKDSKGKIRGILAPVLHVKFLLNQSYKRDSIFVHKFLVEDSVSISREVVYDGSEVHNEKRDSEYWKNYDLSEDDFIYSSVEFFGLKMKVGTAFKNSEAPRDNLKIFIYLWYLLLCLFSVLALIQLVRNSRLFSKLKTANKEIEVKNAQLQESLEDSKVLFKEVHHRVKNNLQIISSLLNLQSSEYQDENIRFAFEESKGRIQSMALVHQKLYGNDSLTNINVLDYCQNLISSVELTLSTVSIIPEKKINIDQSLNCQMDCMVPLGLILNELVTNSYKYAFDSKRENHIDLTIIKEESELLCIYSDSGNGIPDEIDIKNSGTLGLELIHILAEQLDGSVEYTKSKESHSFRITLKH